MNIEQGISLRPYNTFHIEAIADHFVKVTNETELIDSIQTAHANNLEIYVIGGGSNILLTKDIHGLVILNEIKGIDILYEDDDVVHVKFQGGENWHECVMWCVEHNLGGIENLSLIPGTMGAAPIQNIGAYGVELKDVLVEVEAIEIKTGKKHIFSHDACHFGYRNSIFKLGQNGRYIILSVILRLSKNPVYNTSYGTIKEELELMGVHELSLLAVSEAVIRIRKSKLPDPTILGNAGSFFKNPTIAEDKFEQLRKWHPTIPGYKNEDGIKVPAAWLIEHSHPENATSWKGYRDRNYGVHEKQALCLVNYSDASGSDIFSLSERIITSVQQAFNILLEREVNIW